MYTPLEALYTYATERGDLTHWLPNQDIVDTYHCAVEHACKQTEQIQSGLSAEHAALFQKLMDNLNDTRQLETEMLFYQGLAMGLQLGALSLWV